MWPPPLYSLPWSSKLTAFKCYNRPNGRYSRCVSNPLRQLVSETLPCAFQAYTMWATFAFTVLCGLKKSAQGHIQVTVILLLHVQGVLLFFLCVWNCSDFSRTLYKICAWLAICFSKWKVDRFFVFVLFFVVVFLIPADASWTKAQKKGAIHFIFTSVFHILVFILGAC